MARSELPLLSTQGLKRDILCTEFGNFTVKRLDLIHPEISGNKWFKLRYNVEAALASEHKTLLTFGGAWSNHIHATAYTGKLFGVKTIGIIRGEEERTLSPTLVQAQEWGMQFEFISRADYRQKTSEDFIKKLHERFGDFHLVPEGGANQEGIRGCLEILDSEDDAYDYICCDCGTGATLAGIILSSKAHQHIIGIPVLKGASFLREDILTLMSSFVSNEIELSEYAKRFELLTDYHFGGFGKWNDELIDFIRHFEKDYHIPLDQIYTGKLFYAVMDLLRNNFFKEKHVLILHTGGLQGRRSVEDRLSNQSDKC